MKFTPLSGAIKERLVELRRPDQSLVGGDVLDRIPPHVEELRPVDRIVLRTIAQGILDLVPEGSES